MEKYHKINGLYKRDDKGKFINEFAQPEFEYLYDKEWIGTEKIDGANIRANFTRHVLDIPGYAIEKKIKFEGRQENSQIPATLVNKINEIFTYERIEKAFPHIPNGEYEELDVIFFGEGYGAKIQKGGGNYISDGVDFILFDVKIGDWWIKREDVNDIANKMGIKSVDVVFKGNLTEAILKVKKGFKSNIGKADAEGLVLVPSIDLFNRRGDRIITKLKTKDFK